MATVEDIMARHEAAGTKVRELKAAKAEKAAVDAALATLLACKAEYKTLTGNDFPAAGKVCRRHAPLI